MVASAAKPGLMSSARNDLAASTFALAAGEGRADGIADADAPAADAALGAADGAVDDGAPGPGRQGG